MRISKVLKLTGFGLASIFLLGITGLFYSFQNESDSEEKTIKEMLEQGVEPTCFLLEWEDEVINTVYVGDPTKQKVLFIHGSPGDWTSWSGLMTDSSLLANFFMISFDRPGYGGTTIDPQADLAEHGRAAIAIMEQFGPNEKFIIAGHSYGGAVVGQVLVSAPERVEKAILAAPAISPDHQEARWYNKMARLKLINMLIGKDMRSSNVEMIGLSESLRNIEDSFPLVQTPQVFIHGEKDILVPYATVDYWQSHKMPSVDYVLRADMNHFVPFSDPDLIIKALLGIEQE